MPAPGGGASIVKRLLDSGAAPLAFLVAVCGCGGDGGGPERRIDLGGGVSIELVRIEPGRFTRTEPGDSTAEQTVRIDDPFYIGRTEITNRQFRRFQPGYDSNDPRGGGNIPFQRYIASLKPEYDGDEQPVVHVSWLEAYEFTEWLREKTGLAVRLPSEAEWEYACRAGSTGRYSWGDDPSLAHRFANANDPVTGERFRLDWGAFPADDGYRVTAPVATFEPNAFGLYDMHGNAAEWTLDYWHDDLGRAPVDGSAWETDGWQGMRVYKGNDWTSSPEGCTCSFRNWNYIDNHNAGAGFRIVLNPEPGTETETGG